MTKVSSIGLSACCLTFSFSSLAFDNDLSINRPNFNVENFLDINSVHFDESLNEMWRENESGWRMTGHSLTSNLLHTDGALKFKQEMSGSVNFYLSIEQEVFYADKPFPDPRLEIEYFPFDYPLGFSFISTTDYNKSEIDMGYAITLGKRTENFLQYEKIKVDRYFNKKNSDASLDEAEYSKHQYLTSLRGYYDWKSRVSFYIDYEDASRMIFHFDDQITTFTHGGEQYDGYVKSRFSDTDSLKLALTGFKTDKSRTTTGSDQQQQLEYESVHLKWSRFFENGDQLNVGLRNDTFETTIVDSLDSTNDLDYSFKTTQVYASYLNAYDEQKAWDIGLYLGRVREPFDPDKLLTDADKDSYQSQLRLSWQLKSKDAKSSLLFHFSINLDDIANHIGDGVGVTYQSVL